MVESIIRSEDRVLGRKPSKRKAPFKGGRHTAQVFGLQNLSELTELQEYLELNGNYHLKHVPKDGSCFWRSVLEQILYPAVLVFCGGNHYVQAGEERCGAEISP